MSGLKSGFRRRLVSASMAAALACSGLAAVATAAPAAAICDAPRVVYKIVPAGSVWKRTSLSSSYVRGPGSVALTKGRTWNVSASMTATVSAEASVVFAKASTSLGVTVGAGYSGSQAFTYSLTVPSGQVRRLQQYKSARKFTVKKYALNSPCSYRLVYSSPVIAPVRSNAAKYFLYQLVK